MVNCLQCVHILLSPTISVEFNQTFKFFFLSLIELVVINIMFKCCFLLEIDAIKQSVLFQPFLTSLKCPVLGLVVQRVQREKCFH